MSCLYNVYETGVARKAAAAAPEHRAGVEGAAASADGFRLFDLVEARRGPDGKWMGRRSIDLSVLVPPPPSDSHGGGTAAAAAAPAGAAAAGGGGGGMSDDGQQAERAAWSAWTPLPADSSYRALGKLLARVTTRALFCEAVSGVDGSTISGGVLVLVGWLVGCCRSVSVSCHTIHSRCMTSNTNHPSYLRHVT